MVRRRSLSRSAIAKRNSMAKSVQSEKVSSVVKNARSSARKRLDLEFDNSAHDESNQTNGTFVVKDSSMKGLDLPDVSKMDHIVEMDEVNTPVPAKPKSSKRLSASAKKTVKTISKVSDGPIRKSTRERVQVSLFNTEPVPRNQQKKKRTASEKNEDSTKSRKRNLSKEKKSKTNEQPVTKKPRGKNAAPKEPVEDLKQASVTKTPKSEKKKKSVSIKSPKSAKVSAQPEQTVKAPDVKTPKMGRPKKNAPESAKTIKANKAKGKIAADKVASPKASEKTKATAKDQNPEPNAKKRRGKADII